MQSAGSHTGAMLREMRPTLAADARHDETVA
jgi:hypothetical protein